MNKKLTYYQGRIKNPRWISYIKYHKRWRVSRVIHNVKTYYGSYKTEEEAEAVVEFLNENDWDKNKLMEWLEWKKKSK